MITSLFIVNVSKRLPLFVTVALTFLPANIHTIIITPEMPIPVTVEPYPAPEAALIALYNYVDQRLLVARNLDLPRRVRFKRRYRKHRKEGYQDIKQTYRNRRTYKDFERFIEAHPDAEVIEMDTVKGSNNGGKVFLTMFFRNSSFILIFLLPQGKCKKTD